MIQSIIEILEQMKIGITDGEPSINGADMQTTAEQLQQLFHKHHVRSSAEANKVTRHKSVDALLELTSSWNESGAEIPTDYVNGIQRAIMNVRLD